MKKTKTKLRHQSLRHDFVIKLAKVEQTKVESLSHILRKRVSTSYKMSGKLGLNEKEKDINH